MTMTRSLPALAAGFLLAAVGSGAAVEPAIAGEAPPEPAPPPPSEPAPAPAPETAGPAPEGAPAPPAKAKKKRALTTVYLTGGGGGILDEKRGAFTGSLVATRPIGGFFAIELAVNAGWSPSGAEREDLFYGRLSLGARFEPTRAAVRPYGAFRLTHVHMATLHTWTDHPLESAAGSSEHGLGHRSGMALAGGISFVVPGTKEHLLITTGVEMLWIALGHGPRWLPTAEVGLGVAF